jgi:hypothetical protein
MAMAMLNYPKVTAKGKPLFVTLTYPDKWDSDWKKWKRDIDVFGKRIKRRYLMGFLLWKMEFQKRGAPHFHGVAFNTCEKGSDGKEKVRIDKDWLSRAWYEVVGSGDEKHLRAGTRVEVIRSFKQLMSYTSKYLGKVETAPEGVEVGRVWGIVGRQQYWEFVDKSAVPIPAETFFPMRRVLARVIGMSLRGWHRGLGLSCFLSAEASYRLLVLYYVDPTWRWEDTIDTWAGS